MKGVILAGGNGTRLYPSTIALSKQLLPVYNKPMIYYPLSILMLAGIRDILIISSPDTVPLLSNLLKDGHHLGLNITYYAQPNPDGLPQAFILGQEFIGNDNVCLILGDNIYYGQGLTQVLEETTANFNQGAQIFGYLVNEPYRYGIAEISKDLRVINIEEKPQNPKSNCAITGLYFYDNNVISIAKDLQPSTRGELEITDVNLHYLKQGNLNIKVLGRGIAWFDTGTHQSLLEASQYIATIEHRQNLKIACIEEIALRKKYISTNQLETLVASMGKSIYSDYLYQILEDVS
ncbi:MAG: glucose-1-phosphate thymidylyltransferase RfbA [Rickettsiales endosymbiont of Dermacentor nuttalli]